MDSLGNILYYCTLLQIICEHLHDLYTLNSLLGRKGLKKINTERFSKFPSNVYSILFGYNMKILCTKYLGTRFVANMKSFIANISQQCRILIEVTKS